MLVVLCCVAAARAQSEGDVTPLSSAPAVTCEEDTGSSGKPVHSSTGSIAQVEMKVVKQGKGTAQRCLTSWTLRVSGPQVTAESLELQTREDTPEDNEWTYEKSFDLLAWSKDGTRVLTAAIMAAGDWDETTPLIYDFSTRKHWRVELEPLFKTLVRKNCSVYLRPIRFASPDEVVVFAAPSERENHCFQSSLWAVNYKSRKLRKLRNSK